MFMNDTDLVIMLTHKVKRQYKTRVPRWKMELGTEAQGSEHSPKNLWYDMDILVSPPY